LFEAARSRVVALIQSISAYEFLPVLTGKTLSTYVRHGQDDLICNVVSLLRRAWIKQLRWCRHGLRSFERSRLAVFPVLYRKLFEFGAQLAVT
jgi:hypothetical protein